MASIILIGLSLSMDAFAISVSSGITIKGLKPYHALRAALFFGLFQFIMPVAGWYLGYSFASYIKNFDHWIAFGLLAFIGGKMVVEGAREIKKDTSTNDDSITVNSDCKCKDKSDIRSMPCLLSLSIATSIDALAVGLSFSLLGNTIWLPAMGIGIVTFLVCMIGFEASRLIGPLLGKWAEIAGGLVLIGIGAKILLEHLLSA
ncbi:manganese efflux pump MntP family protein [Leadbettera azotonutricia]|uniref:Putative manganese efflux pump MntP n=1 Tax=Leadbettera azotonutricia (strain ATCC BAA-888 / DSM 13862 / ZAS-9) TaxID=545695 RepID=F5YFV9_LEAAZ|nr:manganese efflux pump MntP family protein [Leadbettera azotonutricia]AEF82232.1 membrane protein [Leadbettera azotonutricia ZAS-9]